MRAFMPPTLISSNAGNAATISSVLQPGSPIFVDTLEVLPSFEERRYREPI